MTVDLDPPLFRDRLAIAVVTRRAVRHFAVGGNFTVSGSKEPLAVLIHDGTSLRAWRIGGGEMTATEADHLLPGVEDRLLAGWRKAFAEDPG